jgi:replicative DNA helicase
MNLEAEQALLGAILVNNAAHDRVLDFLEPSHFYDPLHQRIFEVATRLIAAGKQATPITLKTFFETLEPIDATTTVPPYLGKLAVDAATIINAREYGRTIHDLATRRLLILIGEDLVNAAYDSPVEFPPSEQIEEAEARLYALAEREKHGDGEVNAEQMYAAAVDAIDRAHEHMGAVGLSTGFRDLDSLVSVQPSDLVVVAARPSMGKTSLAISIIRKHEVAPVHFFSLEMSFEQIALQILSAETGIASTRLQRGELDEEGEWRRVFEAKDKLSKQPLRVDATGGISIGQLAARARRVKRQHGTQLIFVDYLQLVRGTKHTENRVQEVSEITAGLKALAKELNVPVIALSQLSREVEKRGDKRPQLADLRESGSIEQDADTVLFVYREEYYQERLKPMAGSTEFQTWVEKMKEVKGKAEVIIGKQRRGPIGTVYLQFDASCTRFSNLAHGGQASN